MKRISKKLKEEAKKEAVKLRENATPEELAKLKLGRLDPRLSYACIYGQMTGDCFSRRAHELLDKCAIAYTSDYDKDRANGYGHNILDNPTYSQERFFSAIETLIVKADDSNRPEINANLIAYLKGETDEFTF